MNNLPNGYIINKTMTFSTAEHSIYGSNIVISGLVSISVSSPSQSNKIIFDKLSVKSNSIVAESDIVVNNTLILEPGSKYTTGTNDIKNFEFHWINNEFPCFTRTGLFKDYEAVKIVFDGNTNIGYNELLYGKKFTLIKAGSSSYCSNYLDKISFISSVSSFSGENSIFDKKCDANGDLIITGAREIVEIPLESSLINEDFQTSVIKENVQIESSVDINESLNELSSLKDEEIQKKSQVLSNTRSKASNYQAR